MDRVLDLIVFTSFMMMMMLIIIIKFFNIMFSVSNFLFVV